MKNILCQLSSLLAIVLMVSVSSVLWAMPCPQLIGQPKQVMVAIDESDSITTQQRAEWEPLARNLVTQLCPGGHFQEFGIHSNTVNSRPLFDGSLPLFPHEGATIQQLILFKQEVQAFRSGAFGALSQALGKHDSSKATDVFGIFDRVPKGTDRRVNLVIFSDALHANSELNLEQVKLKDRNFEFLIQKLSLRHHWDSTTLAGVVIHFVLPSLQDKDKMPGPNDRLILKSFYSALITRLGGTLATFDTGEGGVL